MVDAEQHWCVRAHPSAFVGGVSGYSVSQFGGWVQFPTGQFSNGHQQHGRHSIMIGGKHYYVHRLVAHTHLPPTDDPNKTIVNHMDGNPSNNDFTNLEWVTTGENNRHAHATGPCYNRREQQARARDGTLPPPPRTHVLSQRDEDTDVSV
ncbi:hypothetical protein JKP88DRAFT_157030 [Tribonema minus]|uniref:HNH nuclease domain-containing protein n=1 Tax=Tribonema minus TaxID=303371 RepID=A0A835Z3Q6_9STRA|nr:hypothetical protein JKP88DRAFT_157030 [Tribonema minus]